MTCPRFENLSLVLRLIETALASGHSTEQSSVRPRLLHEKGVSIRIVRIYSIEVLATTVSQGCTPVVPNDRYKYMIRCFPCAKRTNENLSTRHANTVMTVDSVHSPG